ncbi:MAG: hypothetical protein JG765_1318 [Cereibacter sp.]|jgi:hypothetical protein|nr:hypothetical protein [Cereibacter sp.]
MLNLDAAIDKIEELLSDGSEASVTYAALECRLAIERICYERLRVAHDYISHGDLKKWQPRDVVRVLIQEVDARSAETFTLSISKFPVSKKSPEPTSEEYQAMEFLPIGTQVGFDPNRLGRLWNALANLALHVSLPTSTKDPVPHYGDKEAIREKVSEALAEIKRIGEGTLMSTGMGAEVSFNCFCGSKNKRRHDLLVDGQILSCINPICDESYCFVKGELAFERRTFVVTCQACSKQRDIPKKMLDKLRTDQNFRFGCEGCGETIELLWHPAQKQKTRRAVEG